MGKANKRTDEANVVDFHEEETESTIVIKVRGDDGFKPKGEDFLVCIYGGPIGRRYSLSKNPTLIGRGRQCEISIQQGTVSRTHAQVTGTTGKRLVSDLGSTNGIFVNSVSRPVHELVCGDLLKIGEVIFKYLAGDDIESAYHEEIYRLAIEDGLTQLPNKRYLLQFLEREMARTKRYERPISLMMIDVDHFKSINDTYGHLAGDDVLSELANLLKPRIRKDECLARYGGEEFTVVMPETMLRGASQFAEILRASVEEHDFSFDGEHISVTVSIGVARNTDDAASPDKLLARADDCLYKAKRNGRNQVVSYDPT